jgi:hypothetical protein
VLVYAGDTGDKWGYFDAALLAGLGVDVDSHGKMPDVVLHFTEKNWLLLVESVTSHGPVDGKRHAELAKLFAGSKAGLVYVTAFPNRSIMGRYLARNRMGDGGVGGRCALSPDPLQRGAVPWPLPHRMSTGGPTMTTTTTETAKEVLRGYGRANEAALASLMDVQDWQRIARQELERRATSIVQALDDATLEAIAAGTLDMRAMCRQVADEIHQTA